MYEGKGAVTSEPKGMKGFIYGKRSKSVNVMNRDAFLGIKSTPWEELEVQFISPQNQSVNLCAAFV